MDNQNSNSNYDGWRHNNVIVVCERCGSQIGSCTCPRFTYEPSIIPVGWICGKCGASVSPHEKICPKCSVYEVTLSNGTSGCAHDSCPECGGTGKKVDGSMCVHYLYCSCPKCNPQYKF